MTNPTRDQILDAHKALESLLIAVSDGKSLSPFTITSMSYDIRAALPPKPRPTMADVEWDDELHYLAEAEHKDGRIAIMFAPDSSGLIKFIWNGLIDSTYPQNLILTGKRYTLTETTND